MPTFVNNGLLLDGNVAQCQSIFNSTDLDFKADGNDDVVAGQYTLAAIDGAWRTLSGCLSPWRSTHG